MEQANHIFSIDSSKPCSCLNCTSTTSNQFLFNLLFQLLPSPSLQFCSNRFSNSCSNSLHHTIINNHCNCCLNSLFKQVFELPVQAGVRTPCSSRCSNSLFKQVFELPVLAGVRTLYSSRCSNSLFKQVFEHIFQHPPSHNY